MTGSCADGPQGPENPMFLEGIAGRIQSQPDWEVCAHAETAEQALDTVLQTQPDVVEWTKLESKWGHPTIERSGI